MTETERELDFQLAELLEENAKLKAELQYANEKCMLLQKNMRSIQISASAALDSLDRAKKISEIEPGQEEQ